MAHSLQRWACAVLDCVQFHLIPQRYQRRALELYGDAPAPLRWQQVTGAVDLWDQQGASPSRTLPLPDLFCWMCRCLLPMGSTRSCASSPTSRLRPRPAQRMTCSHTYCRCSIQVQEGDAGWAMVSFLARKSFQIHTVITDSVPLCQADGAPGETPDNKTFHVRSHRPCQRRCSSNSSPYL